jgi:hypothetical protein
MEEILAQMEPYFGWAETRLQSFNKRPRRKTAIAGPGEGPQ